LSAMHTVQPKNSFINRYRKRSISPQKFNANHFHSREMETPDSKQALNSSRHKPAE